MEERSKNIQNMFNSIAGRYDLLNAVLSFRRDAAWRKAAIKLSNIEKGFTVLDLTCGTGDMMAEIEHQTKDVNIIGGDFSLGMLKIGVSKLPQLSFTAADACMLPFKDSSFDRITMAFGFRNVTDKPKALLELMRVLKPGGKACILEFSVPENRLFAMLYRFYFLKILPLIGKLVSGSDSAYTYLPESVYNFPKRREYKQMIAASGFADISFTTKTFGIVTIALMQKP